MKSIDEIAAHASTVFVLPETVTRVKACMDDGAASMDDIADIIAFDPALTAQLLKVANSAMYKFPNRIDSITRALQVIGTRAAYDLALAIGVTSAFKDVHAKVIDIDRFWEQSISCGLLAKYIGEHQKHREPERLFVVGLLHNIGELIIAAQFPQIAQRCVGYNAKVKPAELQQAICGFTYAQLSAALIKEWGIPATVWQPVAQIHVDEQLMSSELDIQIVQLAYILALDNVNPGLYGSSASQHSYLYETLGFGHEQIEDALDITNLQYLNVMSLFNPSAFMLY
ncbi:HDOD domain-containing protein [Alteromonas gilva]|uniref:HDOD domain-containing protein n=1 Tax=Alteromonas gilva TaxID=2987522 RepID=A0ABT5L4K3_9ALTE|nr:HDOD domain-containing protein [Alteromonas gilva]MDC8831321.1 HDOD domain-containing protein [Alteromonas gilva]